MYDYDGDSSDLSDEEMQSRSYTEFKLSKVEEDSLKDIEKTVDNKKVNSDNKDFMLKYLAGLLKRVQQVKENERQYEGEDNDNVNEYLARISNLISKIRKS